MRFLLLLLVLPALMGFRLLTPQDVSTDVWWDADVETSIARAGEARSSWAAILDAVSTEHRADLAHLLRSMPEADVTSLDPAQVLENVQLAHVAKARAAWGAALPEDVFQEFVLPYANVTEPRDPWRAEFTERWWPVVKDATTPAAAAKTLNETIFSELGVKYSTARKRADQSPKESIEQGLASCTGLSILLTNACRSVGVPARLVGTPSWVDKQGNHTWVEIWSEGEWHFVGAAEPDPKGLDHGWFEADAKRAIAGDPLHAIFAVGWSATQTPFALPWAPDRPVPGIDVTARYQDEAPPVAEEAKPTTTRFRFDAFDIPKGVRVAIGLRVSVNGVKGVHFEGTTKGADKDTNDILECEVPRGATLALQIDTPEGWSFPWVTQVPEDVDVFYDSQDVWSWPGFVSGEDPKLVMKEWFEKRESGEKLPFLNIFGGRGEAGLLPCVVWGYEHADIRARHKAAFDVNKAFAPERLSPYTVKTVGKRPADGWGLVIAMHGGGGAAKEVNDSQWEHMQVYYKDHPEHGGYKYVALRAPNNEWNGVYDDKISPLIENLVQQFVRFGDVDSDRVHLIGYSHGGYGAFVIGTKIPWRFATIHSSAAAPTGGETAGENLRTTRFTYMVGENDTAYGRRERCEAFAEEIQTLKGGREDIYPVDFLFEPGHGHGGLPDRDLLETQLQTSRTTVPKEITWTMTDDVLKEFSWISVDEPEEGKRVDVRVDGQEIHVTGDVRRVTLWIDSRVVDVTQPFQVIAAGRTFDVVATQRADDYAESLWRKGDPKLSFQFRMDVALRR